MKGEIGIQAIGTALGSTKIDNLSRSEQLGRTRDFAERRVGFNTLHRESTSDPALNLAIAAVEDLKGRVGGRLGDVDLIICVGQAVSVSRIPHLSALLHGYLELQRQSQVFDVGLGCSGWVHALAIAKAIMESQKLRTCLVVTADPYSLLVDHSDVSTELIFSDGATASLLTRSPMFRFKEFDFGVESTRASSLSMNDLGLLHMDGRAVLDFAIKNVPDSIQRVVSKSGLEPELIGEVLLHQGSKVVVEMLASRLEGLPQPKFISAEDGNTVSSTLPLAIARGGLEHRYTVVCGFGVGLSWATTILENPEGKYDG